MSHVAAPTAVRFEHRTDEDPCLGIGTATPRLSWIVPERRCRLRPGGLRGRAHARRERTPRSSGSTSGEQVLVPWPAAPLTSRESARVRVRVRGAGMQSAWSDPATVEAGLLRTEDWTARFISPRELGGLGAPAPVLRSALDVPGGVVKARLYATAHGLYDGQARTGVGSATRCWRRAGPATPHRLRYQTYDVTDLVREGGNELEVLLGNGWYRGRLGLDGRRGLYGDRLALLAQLEVTTADGAVHVLAHRRLVDRPRERRPGRRPLRRPADRPAAPDRRPQRRRRGASTPTWPGWSRPTARRCGSPRRCPRPTCLASPSGATLVDFGQNLVGWVRLRVRDQAPGQEVVIRHAEVLEHGELGVRPLRTREGHRLLPPGGRDAGGAGAEPHLPRLPLRRDQRPAARCAPRTSRRWSSAPTCGGPDGSASSNPQLNRFHENVVWGMRGNFVDVPTDCPQRDERLGWTGDIQVFAPTASFLFDSAGLPELLAGRPRRRAAAGRVGAVRRPRRPRVAAVRRRRPGATPPTLVPWVLYQRTGDVGLLARQLPSMRAWVDHIAGLAGADRLWTGGFQFGDWLDPTAPPDAPFEAQADPDVVATAHLARSAEVVGPGRGGGRRRRRWPRSTPASPARCAKPSPAST